MIVNDVSFPLVFMRILVVWQGARHQFVEEKTTLLLIYDEIRLLRDDEFSLPKIDVEANTQSYGMQSYSINSNGAETEKMIERTIQISYN